MIDVWDVTTFDDELVEQLGQAADLIRSYTATANRIFLSHDLGREPRRSMLRPENPFAAEFQAMSEGLAEQIKSRPIRAWHYTRLTELEVETLLRSGIHLSTPDSLHQRLNDIVSAGHINTAHADDLFVQSPFHKDPFNSRPNRFWMTSHPVAVDDLGVVPLMAHWGGEVASQWVEHPDLRVPLGNIGKPRVLEIVVPLALTRHSLSAADAVIATFGRSLGCITSKKDFDLYSTSPLPAETALAVHSHGDALFESIGRTYPRSFVDVGPGYWRELTGDA